MCQGRRPEFLFNSGIHALLLDYYMCIDTNLLLYYYTMSKIIKKKQQKDEFEAYLAQHRPHIVYRKPGIYKPSIKSYNFNEIWQDIDKKD